MHGRTAYAPEWKTRNGTLNDGKQPFHGSGRTPLERAICHGESWHIAPVSGRIPVSGDTEEYLETFRGKPRIDQTNNTMNN
jgi:hypothetical protein